jgi:hypothetical protein
MTKAALQQNREKWQQRVAEFRASGLSRAAWCASQGIKPHLLQYWAQQFALPTETNTTIPSWQPVMVSDGPTEKASGTMLVRIGVATIEVPWNFDSQLLTNVVRVLVAVC